MRTPNQAQPRKFRKRYVFVPLALILAVGAFMIEHHSRNAVATIEPAAGEIWGEGSSGTAALGGTFRLVSASGQPVSEQTLVGGGYHLLFFGFASCPDVCPAALQMMAYTRARLPQDVRDDLQFVFITLDPARDSATTLRTYINGFDSSIEGWTGTQAQIDAMAKNYLVYHAKVPLKPMPEEDNTESEDYTIDHSAFFYLIGPDGSFVKHFPNTISQQEFIERLTTLVRT